MRLGKRLNRSLHGLDLFGRVGQLAESEGIKGLLNYTVKLHATGCTQSHGRLKPSLLTTFNPQRHGYAALLIAIRNAYVTGTI